MVGDRMRSTCADDMNKMGLEVISFTIKEVRDKNEYIANMGRPDVARIKRDADVAAAEAERDTAIKRARGACARRRSPRRRPTRSACSRRRCRWPSRPKRSATSRSRRRSTSETVKQQQAQADKAYEIQTNIMQQQVVAEAVKVQQIEKEQQVKVQEAEIMRREKELIATVLKQAEIERQRIETLAAGREAAADRSKPKAARRRFARRAKPKPRSSSRRARPKRKAMNVKAEAYQEYNQAAVVDKLLTGMPEVVRALAARWPRWTRSRSSRPATATRPGCTRSPATWPRWRRRCRRCSRRCPACRCRSCWAKCARSATSRRGPMRCRRTAEQGSNDAESNGGRASRPSRVDRCSAGQPPGRRRYL